MAKPQQPPSDSPSGRPYDQIEFTLPAAQIVAGARTTLTAALPGAQVGALLALGSEVALDAGLAVVDYGVYAANVASLIVMNVTAGNITPAAARIIRAVVFPRLGA